METVDEIINKLASPRLETRLMLDEIRFLCQYDGVTTWRASGTIIAVTHDRYFLDNVAGWILELDRGRGIPWKGNYSSWLEQKIVSIPYLRMLKSFLMPKECPY